MPLRRQLIPMRGVSDATAFIDQPGDVNPPEVLRNFIVGDPLTKRARGGMRPTLRRLFAAPLGNGPIQGLCKVNRPSVSTGFVLGDATALGAGASNGATTLVGNTWGMDSVPSLEWGVTLDATAVVAAPSPQMNASCRTPDETLQIIAGSAQNGTYLELKVRAINPSTGATVWTYTYSDAAKSWYVTAVHATNQWVFVYTRNEIHVLWAKDPYTGAGFAGQRAQRHDFNSWSDVAIGGGTHTETRAGGFGTITTTYLTAAFYGTSRAGTIVGGTLSSGEILGTAIDVGLFASHFRTGLMRFTVAGYPATGPYSVSMTVLAQVTYGVQLAASDPRYESAHGYYRVSEQSICSPHGCYITDVDVASDGSVVFSRTNQGWGPTASWRPTGFTRPNITLVRLGPGGSTTWEMDAGAIRGTGTGSGYYAGHPHYNDINDPTFTACCFGASGEAYIGGKKNDAGYSLLRVSQAGGVEGGVNVMDATRSVRKEALTLDPSDGNVLVGGDRNQGWDGSGGTAYAHLWKVNAATLEIVWSWDIGKAVSALAVSAFAGGRIVYGTDYAS